MSPAHRAACACMIREQQGHRFSTDHVRGIPPPGWGCVFGCDRLTGALCQISEAGSALGSRRACNDAVLVTRSQQRRIHKLLACNKLSLQLAGCTLCHKQALCYKQTLCRCNQLVADSICYKRATCEFGAVVIQARHRYKHADFPARCQLH